MFLKQPTCVPPFYFKSFHGPSVYVNFRESASRASRGSKRAPNLIFYRFQSEPEQVDICWTQRETCNSKGFTRWGYFLKDSSRSLVWYKQPGLAIWVNSCSVVSDPVTPWTAARQAPLSVEFSRQECWSGLPFPPPGEYSQPRDGIHLSCIIGRFVTFWATSKQVLILPSLLDDPPETVPLSEN